MKLIQSVFAGFLLLSSTYLNAQTADEVVAKHIAAIGGKEVISKITSQVMESEMTVMGNTLSSTTTLVVGKGFKNVSSLMGQEIVQVITTTGGWMINPMAGSSDPQVLPEDQVKASQSTLDLGGELYEYEAKGNKVELAGNEDIDGVKAIKLKVTTKDGQKVAVYLDPSTYYILKREVSMDVNGEEMTTSAIFSDYKKTDFGFVMPFKTVMNQGFEMSIAINKVEFNKEISPTIFDMPK